MSLTTQAKSMGLPMQLKIDDGLRYSDCSAHMATLVSIEGKHAIYKGQCMVGHTYEQRFLISEVASKIKRERTIVNGEIVIGDGQGHALSTLEDY